MNILAGVNEAINYDIIAYIFRYADRKLSLEVETYLANDNRRKNDRQFLATIVVTATSAILTVRAILNYSIHNRSLLVNDFCMHITRDELLLRK